jgi:hypothetical protein
LDWPRFSLDLGRLLPDRDARAILDLSGMLLNI